MDRVVILKDPTSAVRQARTLAAGVLSEWDCDPACIDDAVLVVSEMVTNAVRHSGGRIRLRLCRTTADSLRVEVQDASSAPPRLLPLNLVAERGRGLRIVARLANRWGSTRVGGGKVVWVDLTCRAANRSRAPFRR